MMRALLLALCASLLAAPAAARSMLAAPAPTGTISCYMATPGPNGGVKVTPTQFSRKEGYEVCVKYPFPCTSGDMLCSTQDVQEKKTVWRYASLSTRTCNRLKNSPGVKNVHCCAADNCNEPSA